MLEEKAGYLDDMPLNVRIINIRNYPLHCHYDHEFIYVLKGSVVLKCGSSIYEMQQGDIFITNDSEVHGIYDCSSDNIVLMIQISSSFFSRQFPTLPYSVYRTIRKEKSNKEVIVLRNLLLKIAFNYITQPPGYRMMNTNIMVDVLNHCENNFRSFYFEGKTVMQKKYDHPEMGERIGRTIEYIYEHHHEKLSLRELAEKEHFSEWYMSKLIAAGTGLGFRELLAFARVEESEKMLLSSSEKISSIAAKVGFSTTAYYEKFFEKWFGYHPEEYRKKYFKRIKGRSMELVFELSKSQKMSIIQDSINSLSFANGEKAGEKVQCREIVIDAVQKTKDVYKSNIVCRDNRDDLTGSFGNLDRLARVILAGLPDNRAVYYEFDCESEQYALESVLVIPYMAKEVLNGKRFMIPACRNSKENNLLLDGRAGLFTANGIPKSLFNACRVIKLLEGEILSFSDYHIATRSADGNQITVLLFNTETELENLCEKECGMREVQNTIDALDLNTLSVRVNIDNMVAGLYQIIESTYTHRSSLLCLANETGFNEKKMTDEEILTAIEMITPATIKHEEYFDGKAELEYDLKGVASKIVRITKK